VVRRLAIGVGGLLLVALLGLGTVLGLAHRAIRQLDPPLPADAEVEALVASPGGPVAVAWQLTASQPVPRGQVLDPALDPEGDAPYVMSHPAFALAWPDGRLLLADVGMEREAAIDFGRPLGLVGAGPVEVGVDAATALGPAALRVGAVLVSHLHVDHVQGVVALCRARQGAPLPLLQTPDQATRGNYTTDPARALTEEAGCLVPTRLAGDPLARVDGFPGVAVVAAAGHTPGSQVLLGVVRSGGRERRLAFTGDVVNHVAGARLDVGKPPAYRALVVPEWDERLGRVRRWLRHLEQALGFELVVAHDRAQLEALDIPSFSALPPPVGG
jgi:glyoxylase-like metal-dependent hydrolase (beta-lactamase superfamily II)